MYIGVIHHSTGYLVLTTSSQYRRTAKEVFRQYAQEKRVQPTKIWVQKAQPGRIRKIFPPCR